MPYVDKRSRDAFDHDLADLEDTIAERGCSAGELNYIVTRVARMFIRTLGPTSYSSINEAVGALECAKLELYRRLAAPHEDRKLAENGDVE